MISTEVASKVSAGLPTIITRPPTAPHRRKAVLHRGIHMCRPRNGGR